MHPRLFQQVTMWNMSWFKLQIGKWFIIELNSNILEDKYFSICYTHVIHKCFYVVMKDDTEMFLAQNTLQNMIK